MSGLPMRRLRRNLIRYATVGVLNSFIGFLIIAAVLYLAPSQAVLANAAGYGAGLLISFALNRTWTFSDRRPLRLTLSAYIVLMAVCYGVNLMVVIAASQWPVLGIYVPQLMGMSAYTALMFLGSHFVVFKAAPGREPE